jgi:hypothetical protein
MAPSSRRSMLGLYQSHLADRRGYPRRWSESCVSWVANQIVADYIPVEMTLGTLNARFRVPVLTYLPWLEREDVQVIASYLPRPRCS